MQIDTKHRLLNVSEELFAERGFYGVSIAAIAERMAFSKQALLHHYPSKEKLYGGVLKRISDDFLEQQLEAEQASRDPMERLKTFFTGLAKPSPENVQRTRLLMRELLDNNGRANRAENWYLKRFLTRLIQTVKAVEGLDTLSDAQALITAYQWLGAVNYFLISPPTLSGIFGEAALENIHRDFSDQLIALIESGLKAHSGNLYSR